MKREKRRLTKMSSKTKRTFVFDPLPWAMDKIHIPPWSGRTLH
jgi:hypothetical protein